MKKIYTLMAALLCVGAANATVNFTTKSGEVIESGKTYTWSEYTDMNGLAYFDPEIFIISDTDITVDVTANCTTGQGISLCCGGECESDISVTKKNVNLTANKYLPSNFDYFGTLEDGLFVSTDLSIKQSMTLGGDLTKITVVFSLEGGSVTVLVNDNDLTYSNGELNYQADEETGLALYNANGQCVLNEIVSGKGSLSTSNLETGIYVYKFGNKTGKIFVK